MKIHRILFAALTTAAVCSVAFSAGYIKFDGIDGESKDSKHKDWIEVMSLTGVESPPAADVKSPRDVATGQASGRRQYQPIIIRKRIDKSSPKLAEAMAKKKVFPTLSVSDGAHSYVLKEAIISSINKTPDGESISINYTKIEFKNERPAPQAQEATRPRGPVQKQSN